MAEDNALNVLSVNFMPQQFLAILKQCAIRDSLPYLRPALLFASKKIGEEQAFSMCEEERDIEYCNNAVFVVKDMIFLNLGYLIFRFGYLL